MGLKLRVGSLEYRAVENTAGQFEISFSSEEPYTRYGMPEILSHDANAVDLSRFDNGSAALLFTHGRDPNYGRMPIGKIVRAWVDAEQKKCRAIVELDDEDEQCNRLRSKLEKGMLTGVSVGYSVSEWTELKAGCKSADGRFTGPAVIASRWQPCEISLEPVPADASVGYGRSLYDDEEEERTMDGMEEKVGAAPTQTKVKSDTVIPQPAPAQIDVRQAQQDATTAERTRVLEISTLCRSFDTDPEGYLRNGYTVDQAKAALLEKLAKDRAPVQSGVRADDGIVSEELDKVRAAAADGLLLRCGVTMENPAIGAKEFQGMSVRDIAAECLSRAGESNVLRMGKDELLKRSLTPDSAFTAIMANVANKIVLGAGSTAQTTFQHWTSKSSSSDFRPTEYYEISESGSLDEVPQNGELKEGRLSDKPVATRRLITLGKKISFTRQMFINDDISMISRTLAAYTMAFVRGINKTVYDILKDNKAMYDGNLLFSAEHNNLGIAGAPGTATFAQARKLMRNQKDLGGEVVLNLAPSYILSSAADETVIEAFLASQADPAGAHSGVANVFRNSMQLIVDAELDVDSGTQPYYFASDPRMTGTVDVCYLNGNESPVVETQPDFDHLGISYRVYGDRGVTLLGYRGLVKNPGTVTK